MKYPTKETTPDNVVRTLMPLLGMGIFETYAGATQKYNDKLKSLASLADRYTSNSTLHPQREMVMVQLSVESILAPRVDRLVDQNTLMGNFSAREVRNESLVLTVQETDLFQPGRKPSAFDRGSANGGMFFFLSLH